MGEGDFSIEAKKEDIIVEDIFSIFDAQKTIEKMSELEIV